jgi:glucose dehydrogenase
MKRTCILRLFTAILVFGIGGIVQAKSIDDWPMYGRDPQHSFARINSPINASNAAGLVQAWTFTPGDAVTASPTVVDDVVYVGSWDGYFYALNKHTGALKWKFQVDCQATVLPIRRIVCPLDSSLLIVQAQTVD